MDVLHDLAKQGYDVFLYGEAALIHKYGLKKTPQKVQYRCTRTVSTNGWEFVSDVSAYYFDKVEEHIYALQIDDLMCFAIHEKDNELITEIILQLGNINVNKIRDRYFKLYRINTPYHLEDVVRNVKDSNIYQFLKTQGLTYKQFVLSIPSLCDALDCTEDKLNDAIKQLL